MKQKSGSPKPKMLEKLRPVIDPEIQHRHQRYDHAEDADPEGGDCVVPYRRLGFGLFVLADELEVAAVLGDVEDVTHDRKRACKHIDQDVEDHPEQDDARHSAA